MKFLKSILTPPTFDDELKTQQAYMLNIILWVLVIVPMPYVIYTLVVTPENSARALMQAAFGEITNVILLIILKRGMVRAASIIQVSAFWLFFTLTASTGSGVQGEAYLIGYPLVIVIAGILLGGNGAVIITVLSLISGVFMADLQAQGATDAGFTNSPYSTWIVSLVLFPVGAILQHLSTNRVRLALARARASEERYRLISQVSSDYTFSTELDGQGNLYLNWVAGAFTEITGYTYDEYVASGGWLGHLHPDDVELDARDTAILKTNKSVITEIRTFKKDREMRWVRVYANPVWDAKENRLTGIVGAVQDITTHKQAEEREARWRATLEKVVRLGKYVTEVADMRTTIERIWHGVHNELEFERLGIFLYNEKRRSMDGTLGTNNDEEMVEEWDIWYPVTDAALFMRVLERPDGLYFTHNYDVENNIPEGDEMYGVKDYAAVAVWAGDKPVAVICVDRLPSGRAITEEQLEALRLFAGYAGLAIENSRLNAALQAELGQRQDFINELENKNAELERFTYTVSHDLKSPLVTITGFLGYIEKDAANGRLDQVRSSINRISSAAKKMQKLLNDLLELSRIGRIMNLPEDVPFGEIVNEAVDHVRGRLDEVDALIEVQRDFPLVHGDRVRLVEVVQNLLENSIKYFDPQRRLRVEIGMTNHNDKGCPVFFVRDNGIGIETKYHERIFGLFNKLDARSEGTGIGLSLVKRIIEVHDGRIWVESRVGEGATFYFSLSNPQTKE